MAKKKKISAEEPIKHYHRHHSLWRLGIGAFIILLGLAYLLINFGLLSGNFVDQIWKLWPVFLILAGVSILMPRR